MPAIALTYRERRTPAEAVHFFAFIERTKLLRTVGIRRVKGEPVRYLEKDGTKGK